MGTYAQRLAELVRPAASGDVDAVSHDRSGTVAPALTRGTRPGDRLMVRVESARMSGRFSGVDCWEHGEPRRARDPGGREKPFLLVYMLDQEGRGPERSGKVEATEAGAEHDRDMLEALRLFGLPPDRPVYRGAAEVIEDVDGERPIRPMTGGPKKFEGPKEAAIAIEERLPLLLGGDPVCRGRPRAKKREMVHALPNVDRLH